MDRTFLITGGLGFIGSAVARRIVRLGGRLVVYDAETYAASRDAAEDCAASPAYRLEIGDVRDRARLDAVIGAHRPDIIMHLAAETHVDRSIDGPAAFIDTNVTGTHQVLEAARAYHETLTGAARAQFRLHHVSTDEVFGSLGQTDPAFTETTRYDPRSPYAASKAASDHLVRAWSETYGLPVVLSNCSNNYGPWQYPEKLIPLMIAKALNGEAMPVYGRGENVRDWLHVDDHAEALLLIAERGRIGASYNVGGDAERSNIDVVRAICARLDARRPQGAPHDRLICFVDDRPGHDFRYAMNFDHLRATLGWRPRRSFETGLADTVGWYLEHEAWWRGILDRDGGAPRLGTGRPAAIQEAAP
jgi:dTDP-glucose 4,6-dehydratase